MPSPESVIGNSRKRILIRSTNWIGDCVMSLPAVQRLRELEPQAHLTVLCPPKLAGIWGHSASIDDVISFEPGGARQAVRGRTFDVAIVLPHSFRAAWEMWRAGIPRRIGYAGHWRRWLLTDVVPSRPCDKPIYVPIEVAGKKFTVKRFPHVRHQVHRYLDIIRHLGGNGDIALPKISVAGGDLPQLTKFFHDDGLPCVGINAGAEYGPAKRWPADRFAAVAQQIAEHFDCRWILFGGAGDVGIAREIEQRLRAADIPTKEIINVAGQTSLAELFLLLQKCAVLVTNDTGPMHIAAALGTPLVAIFGSTSAELTGPLGPACVIVTEKVECNPCFLRDCPIDFRCMQRISVDQVVEAVCGLLQRKRAGPAATATGGRLRTGWQFPQ